VAVGNIFSADPGSLDFDLFFEASVFERLVNRHVGVFETVLADERDVHAPGCFLGDAVAPLGVALVFGQCLGFQPEV
jgi:hypothetical protein